jgi:hypothetical protein
VFNDEKALLAVEKHLNEQNIFPRRYFYPSLNTFTKVVEYQHAPLSEDLSKRILCLPLYKALTAEEVKMIGMLVLDAL